MRTLGMMLAEAMAAQKLNEKVDSNKLTTMLTDGKSGPAEFVKMLEAIFPNPDKSRKLPTNGRWIYWDAIPKRSSEQWRLTLLDWTKNKQINTYVYKEVYRKPFYNGGDNRIYIIKHGECVTKEQNELFDALWNCMEKLKG